MASHCTTRSLWEIQALGELGREFPLSPWYTWDVARAGTRERLALAQGKRIYVEDSGEPQGHVGTGIILRFCLRPSQALGGSVFKATLVSEKQTSKNLPSSSGVASTNPDLCQAGSISVRLARWCRVRPGGVW